MALPPKVYQFLVGLFASLGSLLYGYDLGVIAQVIASPAFNGEFNEPTENETGAVVSVFTGGAFIGAAMAGPAGDRLGRRLTILIGALVRTAKGLVATMTFANHGRKTRSSCSAAPYKLAHRHFLTSMLDGPSPVLVLVFSS